MTLNNFLRQAATAARLGVLTACLVCGPDTTSAAPKKSGQPDPTPRYKSVAPNLDYAHLQITNQPWSIHIARLDRSKTDFDLITTLGHGDAQGLGTVSAQVAAIPPALGRPLVAVNGDFFSSRGDPGGLAIRAGELISAPADVCFWMGTDRALHIEKNYPELEVRWPGGAKTPMGLNEIPKSNRATLFTSGYGATTQSKNDRELVLEKVAGSPWLPLHANQTYRARVREIHKTGGAAIGTNIAILALDGWAGTNAAALKPGDELQFTTGMSRELVHASCAVGGGPLLVKDGKPESWPVRGASNPYVPRHPRTALGFNARHLFLVVVDGRQPGLSIGMSMIELAEFMQQLGCTDALNLDGGGSSTFWLDGKVMNSPSDKHERPLANALVIVQQTK